MTEILRCECGGRRKVLAMVFDPRAIERVLTHMGLPYSREIDIEFSGADLNKQPAQYVIQPWSRIGNLHAFSISGATQTSHRIAWA